MIQTDLEGWEYENFERKRPFSELEEQVCRVQQVLALLLGPEVQQIL